MDMQTIIVMLVLVGALGVVIIKIRKILRNGGCPCGCSLRQKHGPRG